MAGGGQGFAASFCSVDGDGCEGRLALESRKLRFERCCLLVHRSLLRINTKLSFLCVLYRVG